MAEPGRISPNPMHATLTSLRGLLLAATLALTTNLPAADPVEVSAVKAILQSYKSALEARNAAPASSLFTADSQVFESGGAEGSFADYLAHHIGPELEEFNEFSIRNYQVTVRLESPVALATETFNYVIRFKTDRPPVERRGVTTSVLRKIDGSWKIMQMHTSSRGLPRKN